MNNHFIPYKAEDVKQERFYRIPKAFVEDDNLRENMDSNMKLMYGLLRDRYELSIANNWVDNDGSIYCIYSRENIAKHLNVSKNTVSKCIKNLTDLNLMREVRNGQGRPNHMYISKVEANEINRLSKVAFLETQNMGTNDTKLNETEKIKRYIISRNDVFSFYSLVFKREFNKEHPTVTKEQLEHITSLYESFTETYDLTYGDWKDMITNHFDTLSDKNNGNILSFLSGNELNSPLIRHMDMIY